VILLEDIDGIFVERESIHYGNDDEEEGRRHISFSGLINALDGIRA